MFIMLPLTISELSVNAAAAKALANALPDIGLDILIVPLARTCANALPDRLNADSITKSPVAVTTDALDPDSGIIAETFPVPEA
jgi:hypothetical protein